MDLFPVDWQARDVGGQYTITVTGKTQSHELVCAHIKFFPYCLVRLDGCGRGQTSLFVTQACRDHKALREYCRVVERVPLIGFTNGKKITLALLAFHSRRQMTAAARAYEGAGMATYESGVDPLLRFFHNREIAPAQWIRLDSYAPAADRTTRAPVEVVTTYDKVRASAVTARPPLVLACFDLECYSAERKFPCADNEDDCIIQIATCFQRYGEPEPYRTLVLALRETAAAEGVEVVCFDDEADVINAWCDELAAESADVLVSYNGDQVTGLRSCHFLRRGPGCNIGSYISSTPCASTSAANSSSGTKRGRRDESMQYTPSSTGTKPPLPSSSCSYSRHPRSSTTRTQPTSSMSSRATSIPLNTRCRVVPL